MIWGQKVSEAIWFETKVKTFQKYAERWKSANVFYMKYEQRHHWVHFVIHTSHKQVQDLWQEMYKERVERLYFLGLSIL